MSLPVSTTSRTLLTRCSVAPAANRRINIDFFSHLAVTAGRLVLAQSLGVKICLPASVSWRKKLEKRAEHLRMLHSLSLQEVQIIVSF